MKTRFELLKPCSDRSLNASLEMSRSLNTVLLYVEPPPLSGQDAGVRSVGGEPLCCEVGRKMAHEIRLLLRACLQNLNGLFISCTTHDVSDDVLLGYTY